MIIKYFCLILFIMEFVLLIKAITNKKKNMIINHSFNLLISVLLFILVSSRW